MYAAYASKPYLDGQARDAVDAEADEEKKEAYDSFDILKGNFFAQYSTDLPRKPGSSLIRGSRSRADSVESTYSSVTTDLFITSSQAASPGVSTSYVELTESQERRLSHLLGTDSVTKRLSPTPTPSPPEPNDTSFYGPGSTGKQTYLPSFDMFLQGVGEPRSFSDSSTTRYSTEDDSDYVPITREGSNASGAPPTATSPPRSSAQYPESSRIQHTDSYPAVIYVDKGVQIGGLEDVVGPDLTSSTLFQPRSVELLPEGSVHRSINANARQTLVKALDSRPRRHTVARTNDIPPSLLPTGNGGERARRSLMSISNLLVSPLRPRQHSTRDPSPVRDGPQLKRRRTGHATVKRKPDHILPTALPWVTSQSLESEDELETAHKYGAAPQSRGDAADMLSVPSFGTEPPPTTPDLLLLDLEESESESYDEADLVGDENRGE